MGCREAKEEHGPSAARRRAAGRSSKTQRQAAWPSCSPATTLVSQPTPSCHRTWRSPHCGTVTTTLGKATGRSRRTPQLPGPTSPSLTLATPPARRHAASGTATHRLLRHRVLPQNPLVRVYCEPVKTRAGILLLAHHGAWGDRSNRQAPQKGIKGGRIPAGERSITHFPNALRPVLFLLHQVLPVHHCLVPVPVLRQLCLCQHGGALRLQLRRVLQVCHR